MPPPTTTLFEYQADPQPATPREIAALRRLNTTRGHELLALIARSDGTIAFQATQHVGFLRLAGRTIQVLPKIYRDDEPGDARRATATRNLLHLLEIAGDVPIRAHDRADLLAEKSDWFEVLTHLFAHELCGQWARGPWRTYQRVEDDASPALRGSWRLTEQLRRPERRHLFAVAYDEFTADNPLNRVLWFTVERLSAVSRDPANRRALNQLRQAMEDVPCPPRVTAADAAAVTLTRQNARFATALKMAQLFLAGRSVQLTGGREQSFAFMFDMNRLFEKLVANTLSKDLRPTWAGRGWALHLQQADRSLLVDEFGRPRISLRPDARFIDACGRSVMILDSKYKRFDAGEGVKDSDVYQMFAYAARYACPNVVIVHPGDAPAKSYSTRRGETPWLHVRGLALQGDLSAPGARGAIRQRLREAIGIVTDHVLRGHQP